MAPPLNFFIDTNVLAYAYDRSEPDKQARALAVLDQLVGMSALSTQVLGELFIVLTRKLHKPLPPKDCQGARRELSSGVDDPPYNTYDCPGGGTWSASAWLQLLGCPDLGHSAAQSDPYSAERRLRSRAADRRGTLLESISARG
jgi:hypothetical protein